MDEVSKKKLYAQLSASFPESCIQRTDGKQTGRGYDTTGIAYQFIVNRLNEVLGIGGFRVHREVTVKPIQRGNGKAAFEAICDLTLELGEWVNGTFITFAEAVADGGHVSNSESDARKGAYTNAFKKAAAFHGVGKQAYEGTLDDDNIPEDAPHTMPATRSAPVATQPVMTVVKAPLPTPPAEAPPAGYVKSPPPVQQERNRLSSKQLAAIWSIARKLAFETSAFRNQVKQRFGAQLEFLTRQQASQLIDSLNAQLNSTEAQSQEGAA